MKVRFVLPAESGEEPRFDKTVDLPNVPLPGESIGIDLPPSHPMRDGSAWIVEVARRRWYINGDGESVVEVWLSDDERSRRHNLYVHSGCRYGYEKMMESIALYGR